MSNKNDNFLRGELDSWFKPYKDFELISDKISVVDSWFNT